MKTVASGVTAKVFIGLLLNPESKNKLTQNKAWLDQSEQETSTIKKVTIIHYQNKEYAGIYIDHGITMNEFKMNLLFCLDRFKTFLPDLHIDALKLTIFPQIFIS